jgi:signal transduction histidine kinase
MDRINSSTEKLKSMVEDVLDIVSAETGQLHVSPQKVSLPTVAERVIKEFCPQLKEKNQNFEPLKKKAYAWTDEVLLVKVLRRLIDNAIKFGDEKSTLHLDFIEEEDQTRIVVSNQGQGPNPKIIEQLLKPFTLDENVFHHSKGLGLGLSLSQSLLRRQGSSLEMKTSPNKVQVSFLLPKP